MNLPQKLCEKVDAVFTSLQESVLNAPTNSDVANENNWYLHGFLAAITIIDPALGATLMQKSVDMTNRHIASFKYDEKMDELELSGNPTQ